MNEKSDPNEVEQYLLKPIDSLIIRTVNYIVLRYNWAKMYERDDFGFFKGIIRENWEEIENYNANWAMAKKKRYSVIKSDTFFLVRFFLLFIGVGIISAASA
jgi:hypothetical protein